ncbi:N-acetylmuramoyl-L-alanine amidase-like domain-containing protein [Coxiella endosymbiont of Ornithodoros maritimus]|uniref:N-acetylmuramoyl-L-alanine amidase-like domain-containing protein n=1 Tax=Coxiella endosymbiont of Ornithodoros maritimus TaxID=1656172 RepID=UPI0022646E98|nr:N-acetylmuramoyl-L-alanine amidase-like domain-containing protein [Coxiella endosymbiont of Ornithodoros maritimus]
MITKKIFSLSNTARHIPIAIRYYNRNNFISSDFNPVNQASGLLKDVTNKGVFSSYARKTSALINRQKWFAYQVKPNLIGENVRIIRNADGLAMYHRFKNKYPTPFHTFSPEIVSVAYVPKETFVKKSVDSKGTVHYQPNLKLINQIPTLSVIEIIRDVKQWTMNKKNIKDVIGSELNVSHLGLLYRDHFSYGSTIFKKITCSKNKAANKVRSVTPQICSKKTGCVETLFLHATEAYLDGYYYQDAQSHCQYTAKKPAVGTPYSTCNRLLALPLGDYLTTYQYDHYVYLENPAIFGINIKKISN